MKHLRYLLMAALVAMPLTACDEDSDPVVDPIIIGTVTGTVSADGTGLAGVAVTLVGAVDQSATTGAGGTYTFTNVPAGSYGVSIDPSSHPDVSWGQTSRATTITTNGETQTVDFPGSYIKTSTITGVVSASGAPLAGVAVTVTGGPESVNNSYSTNAGGEYFATGLRAGTYTVAIPVIAGVTFASNTASVTVGVGETQSASFPGEAQQFGSITGAVTVDNVGTAGIMVALTGAATADTETGPGGAYAFNNLLPGAYTVTITPPAETTFDVVTKNEDLDEGENAVVNFAGAGPVEPAKLSIQSITTGAGVPVVLTNVAGQIEITLNVTRGDRDLDHVDVLIDDVVVASQTFAAPPAPAEAVGEEEVITLSVPTTQVRMEGDLYVPVIFNGGAFISANLFEVDATAPIPSNEVPVVMNNVDALMLGAPMLTPDTDDPSVVVGANTWYTGNATFTGPIYLSYSTMVPTSSTWLDVGTAGCTVTGAPAGTPTTGLVITNNYNCAGTQGTVIPDAMTVVNYLPPMPIAGPDGSVVTYPLNGFSALGAPFMLNDAMGMSEQRWFLLPPVPVAANPFTVYVDNFAPIVETDGQVVQTLGGGLAVAFNEAFDEPWVNGPYAFAGDISSSDAGGTGVDAATVTAWKWDGSNSVGFPLGICTNASEVIVTGADLVETIASDGTPDGFKLCATAADLLGNVGFSLVSNWFGVDWFAPLARWQGSAVGVTPAITGTRGDLAVAATANTTIFNIADGAPYLVGPDTWGLEGLDMRSGFNQNAVVGYPAMQTITRQTGTFNAIDQITAPFAALGTSFMALPLSDNYVRTSTAAGLAAEMAFHGAFPLPGYYSYTGIVTDRAGNSSAPFVRNWLTDDAVAPTITFATFAATFYAPGTPADFVIFGSDDLEVITASFTMDYPVVATSGSLQYDFGVGTRWDGLDPYDAGAFSTAITGVNVQVPSLFGRIDFTCVAAGVPYPTCAAADALPVTLTDFNVGGTDAGRLPVSLTPISFEDAGGNLSGGAAPILFNVLQFSDSTAAPWDYANVPDIDFWKTMQNGATAFSAEHTASTSIEDPFFDAVVLVLNDAPVPPGTGALVICGAFGAPVLTDNGLNRFWTYGIARPALTSQCGMLQTANPAATYHAVGVSGDALLVSAIGVL
ncbi:MAG: hypothetical protein HKO65_18315 [Gemmatimonadetes bacterium]|nr:hypothetical protein [Gemmatimonadota bacterium]